jgi:hypothetical protein
MHRLSGRGCTVTDGAVREVTQHELAEPWAPRMTAADHDDRGLVLSRANVRALPRIVGRERADQLLVINHGPQRHIRMLSGQPDRATGRRFELQTLDSE